MPLKNNFFFAPHSFLPHSLLLIYAPYYISSLFLFSPCWLLLLFVVNIIIVLPSLLSRSFYHFYIVVENRWSFFLFNLIVCIFYIYIILCGQIEVYLYILFCFSLFYYYLIA
jgi:hypothetical protein